MNQLALVRFVAEASSQISDPNEVIAFLEKTEGKIKNNQEALLLCRVLIGHVQLKKGDQAKTKVLLLHPVDFASWRWNKSFPKLQAQNFDFKSLIYGNWQAEMVQQGKQMGVNAREYFA